MPGPDTTIVVRPTTPESGVAPTRSHHDSSSIPAVAQFALVAVIVLAAVLVARRRGRRLHSGR
jgi:hypothetical protein